MGDMARPGSPGTVPPAPQDGLRFEQRHPGFQIALTGWGGRQSQRTLSLWEDSKVKRLTRSHTWGSLRRHTVDPRCPGLVCSGSSLRTSSPNARCAPSSRWFEDHRAVDRRRRPSQRVIRHGARSDEPGTSPDQARRQISNDCTATPQRACIQVQEVLTSFATGGLPSFISVTSSHVESCSTRRHITLLTGPSTPGRW